MTASAATPSLPYVRNFASGRVITASPEQLFAFVDDAARFSAHMGRSRWQMAGSRMNIEVDDGNGQRVGSRIQLFGSMLGMSLAVEGVVTEREPPYRKAWQTVGAPRLLVVGSYRMTADIEPHPNGSVLRLLIDYSLPERAPARWLGYLLADYYAEWCIKQMLDDAQAHFVTEKDTHASA